MSWWWFVGGSSCCGHYLLSGDYDREEAPSITAAEITAYTQKQMKKDGVVNGEASERLSS